MINNGLSMMRVELRNENESGCCPLLECFKPPENKLKYVEEDEPERLYHKMREKMPNDLIEYRKKDRQLPQVVKDTWFDAYHSYPVHLMPIVENKYFTKVALPNFDSGSE